MLGHFKTGNPIWVYYIDIDSGENIMVPQLLRGIQGCNYHIDKKEFPHYRFIKMEGQANGTFDMQRRDVKLYYRKQSWQNVEDIDIYLQIDKTTKVYDTVNGMPINDPVPAGIVVKAFHRVDTESGDTWYELGAGQWVKYENMRVVNDPFTDEKIPSPIADNLTIMPLKDVQGTIDYLPGKAADVFDAPYGKKVDTIEDGKRVQITGQLNDNGEITWYQIGKNRFITGNYVIVDGQDE